MLPSTDPTLAPTLTASQGVVTAATGAGLTMVLRRALTNTGMASNLGQVRWLIKNLLCCPTVCRLHDGKHTDEIVLATWH